MSASLYSPVLFIHIAAAIVLLGSGITSLFLRTSLKTAATVEELSSWLKFTMRATRANPIAALFLLGSGIYLGIDGWWRTGWFAVAVAAWVINGSLAGAVVNRSHAALSQRAAGRSGPVGDDLNELRLTSKWQIAEDVMFGNDIAILWVMIDKPGLAGALLVLLLANALTLGIGHAARRRNTPVSATSPVAGPLGS